MGQRRVCIYERACTTKRNASSHAAGSSGAKARVRSPEAATGTMISRNDSTARGLGLPDH